MFLRPTPSLPARINAAALLLAILGMIIQIASGVKYPTCRRVAGRSQDRGLI